MKKKTNVVPSLEVLYKTEELLDAASNRYRITVQVANKAKRKRYEDINLLDDFKRELISICPLNEYIRFALSCEPYKTAA